MKKTQAEILEAEISQARSELASCQAEVNRQNVAIQTAAVQGQPDEEVDTLQQQRDVTARQLERLQLKVQALESKRPEAARRDAQAVVPARLKVLHAHSQNLQGTYTTLMRAWEAFSQALERVTHVQRDASDFQECHDDLRVLVLEHDLEDPELPALPTFPPDLMAALYALRDTLARCANWQPIASPANKKRRAKAQEAQAQRRAQSWLAADPATRGPATLEILNGLDLETRDKLLGYNSPAPVHSQLVMKGTTA